MNATNLIERAIAVVGVVLVGGLLSLGIVALVGILAYAASF